MKLQINKTYNFRISVDGKSLRYIGKLTFVDDHFFTFNDKFDKQWVYNINNLITFEEVIK